MAYEATPFDQYSTYGLTKAQGLLDANTSKPFEYPEYVSSAKNAPTQQQFYNYTPTTPLAQIQAPNYQMSGGDYQGLMGGDYNRLEQNLRQPGEQAATDAYGQGYTNLKNVMGGQGLYGSSMMANQATQGLDKTYQNALAGNASNAAAQRYAMEQAGLIDMNKYNLSREQQLNQYGLTQTELGMNQAANTQQSQANEANRLMAYNEGNMNWNQSYSDQMKNWQNQQAYEKYAYDLAKMQAGKANEENQFNQALALAGQGAPLINAAQQAMTSQNNLAAQQAIADQNNATASQNGWLGALGTLGGGLLNTITAKYLSK